MQIRSRNIIVSLVPTVFCACVSSGTHEAVVADLEQTKQKLQTTETQLTTELNQQTSKTKACDERLTTAVEQNQQLITKVSAMGQNVEQLLGEKDALGQERERLASERKELAAEVDELKRLRAAAEARNLEFRKVMDRLRKMTDAGTLQVHVRGGRMLVRMASDLVFPPGGTTIRKEAKEAIAQVAEAMKQFPDRKFQVIGHSDATPIRTERFPSNWELSTQRAIEVARVMIDAGVPPAMISAAGYAEFDPLVANDSEANKTVNRRVEVVFMPKLDELPGMTGDTK